MYEYQAVITRVVDGDTVHAKVDVGFDTHINMTLRLAGINAPELSTPEGIRARQEVMRMVEGQIVKVLTIKDRKEKFGRYLATILIPVANAAPINLNDWLIANGYAASYHGVGLA